MSPTKITLKSAIPTPEITSAPLIGQRAPGDPSQRASSNKPSMSSRKKMTRPAIDSMVRSDARCKVLSLTPYGEKLDALAAQALPAILGSSHLSVSADATESLSRTLLEQAIAQPLCAKDLRAMPSSWPSDVISESMVTNWTSRLVAACDHVYGERGMQAYIDAVTDLIFDEGNHEAGLPGGIRDFCAMLTKNALELGVAQGLDRRALQGLRNTVIIRFLMGYVFVPHLRPTAMRESTSDTTLYAFDRQLFKGFCHRTSEVIDIDAEAIALLAASRQARQAAVA